MSQKERLGTRDAHAALDHRTLHLAITLVAATIGYNVIEAAVATIFGHRAESVGLFGFGLDSIIEVAAATVTLIRLLAQRSGMRGQPLEGHERMARRFIGASFLALALYLTVESTMALVHRDAPHESRIGIGLAVASLLIMPLLAVAKLRVATKLGSRALRAEANETLVCSYLSLTLLIGLAANAVAGWWWADPIAALVMVPLLVKEGREGLRADDCCTEVASGTCEAKEMP